MSQKPAYEFSPVVLDRYYMAGIVDVLEDNESLEGVLRAASEDGTGDARLSAYQGGTIFGEEIMDALCESDERREQYKRLHRRRRKKR